MAISPPRENLCLDYWRETFEIYSCFKLAGITGSPTRKRLNISTGSEKLFVCIEVLEFCVHCAYFSLERFSSSVSLSLPFSLFKGNGFPYTYETRGGFFGRLPNFKGRMRCYNHVHKFFILRERNKFKGKRVRSSSLASSLFYNYVSPFIL